MNVLTALMVVVSIALPIVFIVYMIKKEKQRKEDMRRTADQLKLSYHEGEHHDLLSQLGIFKSFDRGRNRKIYNLMSGNTDDVEIKLFDYRYRTGGGKSSSTHLHTIAYIKSPLLTLPAFSLTPEMIFHKIGDLFGMKDIDFDMYPQFSKQYLLKGEDEEAIRKLFNRERLKFFTDNPQFSIEGNREHVVIYKGYTRVKVGEIQNFFRESLRIAHLFMD